MIEVDAKRKGRDESRLHPVPTSPSLAVNKSKLMDRHRDSTRASYLFDRLTEIEMREFAHQCMACILRIQCKLLSSGIRPSQEPKRCQ